jgi:hypothetical protein
MNSPRVFGLKAVGGSGGLAGFSEGGSGSSVSIFFGRVYIATFGAGPLPGPMMSALTGSAVEMALVAGIGPWVMVMLAGVVWSVGAPGFIAGSADVGPTRGDGPRFDAENPMDGAGPTFPLTAAADVAVPDGVVLCFFIECSMTGCLCL